MNDRSVESEHVSQSNALPESLVESDLASVRWSEIADALVDSVFIIRPDASFAFANLHACQSLDYSREDLLRLRVFDIDPQMSADTWPQRWEEIESQGSARLESVHRTRGGREYPVLIRTTVKKNVAGQAMLVTHATDISDVVQTRQQLRLAVSSAELGFWEYDLLTNDVYASPELLHQIGHPAGETWTLQTWLDLLHPDDRSAAAAVLEDYRAQRRPDYYNIFRFRHINGSYRWIESRGSLIFDKSGNQIRMMGTHLDITERMHVSERLRETLRRTEKVSRSLARSNKDLEQFAYVASHDLRAPLRGLANLATWIQEDIQEEQIELPGSIEVYIEKISEQVHRMDSLLSALLDYSQVDNKQRLLQTVSLHELLDNAVSMADVPESFKIIMPQRELTWETAYAPLQRVFQNLIDNAVKHHDRECGRITIDWKCEDSCYVFSVTDDGPGIPEDSHEKMFEIFRTLQPHERSANTGIGLTIVQKLVQSHGGKIEVHNVDERGTEFRFEWPKKLELDV